MRRPCRVRPMEPCEAAYVGAMIDAEGSFLIGKQRCGSPAYRVTVANTEVEILSAMLRATGTGRIALHPPSPGSFGRKTCFVWGAAAYNDVVEIAQQVVRWSTKAQRFLEVTT